MISLITDSGEGSGRWPDTLRDTAVNFTGATEAQPGTWTWRAGHLGKASRRGSSPGLLLPALKREREELEPPWGSVVTCPRPRPRMARFTPSSGPGQGPGSRPPKWYPPQPWDPHRCSSICPLALLDHAPGLSTNSRTQDRLMTRLLPDWLPPAGPVPTRQLGAVTAGWSRVSGRSAPHGATPHTAVHVPARGPAGAVGGGVHRPQGTLGSDSVALGTLELGDGVRPSPFSAAPTRKPGVGGSAPRARTSGIRAPGLLSGPRAGRVSLRAGMRWRWGSGGEGGAWAATPGRTSAPAPCA